MKRDLKQAMKEIKKVREEFWKDVRIPGDKNEIELRIRKGG